MRVIKRVILFRHSRKGQGIYANLISKEGHEYARLIGEKVLRGRGITGIFVSQLIRTWQTAAALIEGAGDCVVENAPRAMALEGADMEDWERYSDQGHSLEAIENAYPDFIETVEITLERELRVIIDATPQDGTALVVGHTPALELAVQQLTRSRINPNGTRPAPFNPCDGILLAIMSDGSVTIEEEFRFAA